MEKANGHLAVAIALFPSQL